MVLRELADRLRRVHDSRVRIQQVRLELTQKLLPLLLQNGAVWNRVGNGLGYALTGSFGATGETRSL